MKTSRPEAESEYSRGPQASNPDLPGPDGGRGGGSEGGSRTVRRALLVGGLAGSLLLLVAEFTPLFAIHTSSSHTAIRTVQTGSHHSYALIPIAILTIVLTLEVWRNGSRLALLATGVLAIVALLIALLGDLPDAHATGLVGSLASGLKVASASPSAGLYLETLGAVVLLITAAAGLLLETQPRLLAPRRRVRARATNTGSSVTRTEE
jgi:hypothetical protein